MVYIACVLIVCLSGYVGSIIAKTFVLKDKLYKELKQLCSYFQNNISFRQTKVNELFDNFLSVYEGTNKKNIETFKNLCLKKDLFIGELTNFYYLTKEEKSIIINFFKSIGDSNENIEISKIEDFKKYIENKSLEVHTWRKNNQSLTYKLSIAIGAVISILIV